MFKNKTETGKNNICGGRIAELRKQKKWSQRELAGMLQLSGMDLHKNAISKIEAGTAFITDIELLAIAKVLGVTVGVLFED